MGHYTESILSANAKGLSLSTSIKETILPARESKHSIIKRGLARLNGKMLSAYYNL